MDFNSLWPLGFRNILGTWELLCSVRGFIVVGANQIANFDTKTTSLISKFDSKFANFSSKLQEAVGMACVSDNLKSWLLTFKHQLDSETFTYCYFILLLLFTTTVHYLQYNTYNTHLQFEVFTLLTILYSTLYIHIHLHLQKRGDGDVGQIFLKKRASDSKKTKKIN